MIKAVLVCLLVLFSIYALVKFAFFGLAYPRRRALLDRTYSGKRSATAGSDRVLLTISVLLVLLLCLAGGEPVSFLTGLLVGMTLIQLYFHRFSHNLAPEQAPEEPSSPIKTISYAIQASPGRAWREMLAIALLLVGSLVLTVTR